MQNESINKIEGLRLFVLFKNELPLQLFRKVLGQFFVTIYKTREVSQVIDRRDLLFDVTVTFMVTAAITLPLSYS